MAAPVLFGIRNCDTVRKARQWLETHGIDYRFHDFRVEGLDANILQGWCQALGWETLLNRRGTTWRQLKTAEQENLTASKAVQLMLAQPTLIKRPVLVHGKQTRVGFSADDYAAFFR